MKQAVMVAPGEIEFREAPVPVPGPGEVLLRIKRIGICGSDVHVFHGQHPFTSYPVVQGHEFSAVVERLGEGVSGLKVGTKVTATPQLVCGTCPPCSRGDYHICDFLRVQGFQAPGVAQEFFVTHRDKIVTLPDDFTFEQGAMVEPLAVAVHSVSRAGDLDGQNVAVLGAGPIGNLVAQVCRSRAAGVLITDLSEERLEIARRCGLTRIGLATSGTIKEISQAVFGSRGFTSVFECSGAQEALNQAINSIQKAGTIVLVGVYAGFPAVNLSLVQDRELKLIGTLMYQQEDYRTAVRLLAEGSIDLEPLQAKHFPFREYLDAYRFVTGEGKDQLKVFIDMDDASS